MQPDIELSFQADLAHVDLARIALESVLERVMHSEDRAHDLVLALTEVLNNAVEHSKTDRIEVKLGMAPGQVCIQVINEGDPFDSSVIKEMPDMNDLPEGGFGLALLHELTDRVEFEYAHGFNMLTLVKKNPPKELS